LLAAHSTGFFADLARAARDKIVAAEQQVMLGKEKAAEEELKRKAAEAAQLRAAEEARLKTEEAAKKLAEEEAKLKAKLEEVAKSQTPMVVASAPSAAEAARNAVPAIDPADIARLLQFHLKRVGCDPGVLDGKWTDQSAHAMEEFNKREKASFDVKVASLSALDAVKQQKARVCPLVCGKGFKAEEDRCVAEACKRGMVRNKTTGDCERETKSDDKGSAKSASSRSASSGSSAGDLLYRCRSKDRGACETLCNAGFNGPCRLLNRVH